MPRTSNCSPRSVVHGMFCIERTYQASPAQVFKALTDPAAKAKWFAGGDGYTLLAREMDVRPGGREHVKGRKDSGVVSTCSMRWEIRSARNRWIIRSSFNGSSVCR